MKALPALDELQQLWALTDECLAKALTARRRAEKYAHHYRANAEELRRQAARSRFPEIRDRLLRVAESNEHLCSLMERTAQSARNVTEVKADPVTRRPAEDPVAQARRHVAEGERRIERQEALITRLSLDNKHAALTAHAREILATLKYTHSLARDHLMLELKK